MSKRILVEAKTDYIESISKTAPILALEELIWNALDADAREVKVDLVTNALGAVEAVRVSDDGTGINAMTAEDTFGGLGGSWKRLVSETELAKRRLHGRHGCGRFKAFALGNHVEWRTTVRADAGLKSYNLYGDVERPGEFNLDAVEETGAATGTEVYISNAKPNCDSLLDAGETVQALAAKFALYLKSYPDVRIFFNGIPVTPVIVEQRTTDYKLTLENGAEAKLEVIEWKRKFIGAGKLVFSGPDGFQLHERPAQVRSGGIPFTAYLVSPRLSALGAENALVMDELNPEVRMYIDAARKVMKAHFAAMAESVSPEFRKEWSEKLKGLSTAELKQLFELVRRSIKHRQ